MSFSKKLDRNLSIDKPIKPNKGQFDGACNRVACQSEFDVTWYNFGTYKYYCGGCATTINTHNPGLLQRHNKHTKKEV